MATVIEITLPTWLTDSLDQDLKNTYTSLEERMDYVINLAKLNVEHNTGGPFSAAVFEQDTGKLISAGVNRVIPCNCSSAHAEMVALSLAQQHLSSWDLNSKDMPIHQLVSSAQPCIMCFGCCHWSGIKSLIYGVEAIDVVKITGFDEGPIPGNWKEEFNKRGVEVISGVREVESRNVLKLYMEYARPVFNPGAIIDKQILDLK